MDFYLDEEIVFNRLKNTYIKYGRIIVAYDFDATVYPADQCKDVIKLLKSLPEYTLMIVFTARPQDELEFVKLSLDQENIPYNYINKDENGEEIFKRKIYYDIFLDDKAGLLSAYNILKKFVEWVGRTE